MTQGLVPSVTMFRDYGEPPADWRLRPCRSEAAAGKKANATRKPPMKSYASLPKEDVDALVAYMLSLKK